MCLNAQFHEDKGCCFNKEFIGMYGCWCSGKVKEEHCDHWEALIDEKKYNELMRKMKKDQPFV